MEFQNSPIGRLLAGIEERVATIQAEVPGWYPTHLLPVLEDISAAAANTETPVEDWDRLVTRLVQVLEQRPETRPIAAAASSPQDGEQRAMQDFAELHRRRHLPERVRNACAIQVRRIITSLTQQTSAASPPPSRGQDQK